MHLQQRWKQFTGTAFFRVLLHCGFWILYLSIPVWQYVNLTALSHEAIFLITVINLLYVPVYYLFAYVIVERLFTRRKMAYFIIATVLLYVAFYYATRGMENFFISRYATDSDKSFFAAVLKRKVYSIAEIVQICIVTAIPLSLKFMRRYYRLRDEKAGLEKLNADLELHVLRSQLNPHFLFNTLNNIYSLALHHAEQTPEMILKLSDLMRYILYECNVEEIALEKEVHFMQDYIDLEKLRHEKHVNIRFRVEGNCSDKKIPPLLLVPFVENAFKHGVQSQFGRSEVDMRLEAAEGKIWFRIVNNKPHNGNTPSGLQGGIGIENVRKRLSLIYGGNYDLRIRDMPDVFSVELSIALP